jgi:hypothetical protein
MDLLYCFQDYRNLRSCKVDLGKMSINISRIFWTLLTKSMRYRRIYDEGT